MPSHTALLIPVDPEAPIERVTVPAHGDGSLNVLQSLVGGNIEAIRWPPDPLVTCYVHEEGKFECPRNERATGLMHGVEGIYADDFIAGPFVLIGFNPDDGEHTDLNDTLLAMLAPEGFSLQVVMGNEAMQTSADVAQALEGAARTIRLQGPGPGTGLDANGNTVVTWSFR
jgi:hypothetical protein